MSEVTTKPTGAALTVFKTPADFQTALEAQRMEAIRTFMGDENNARKFIMAVVSDVQRVPKLLECKPDNLITEYMKMAELGFMPSSVSGEAYVIPYGGVAQMQPGYKGVVTLLYGAGAQSIESGIIRENDEYSNEDGVVTHKYDMNKSKKARGNPIGAYTKVVWNNVATYYYMHRDDILGHAETFSKAFKKDNSPWKIEKDPELWMWRKTVLIQHAKLLPKNEKLNKMLEYEYEDSNINDSKKPEKVIDVTSYDEKELEDALTKMEGAKDRAELLDIWGKLPTALKANPHVREKSKEIGASFDPK